MPVIIYSLINENACPEKSNEVLVVSTVVILKKNDVFVSHTLT